MPGLLQGLINGMAWLTFGENLAKQGQPAWDAVMAAAQAHGVQTINADMGKIIVEAATYKALADAQVTATA